MMDRPNEDELPRFRQQLSMYDDCDLSQILEYFWNDLIYIVESLDTHRLLSELRCHVPQLENYVGTWISAELLVKHILGYGRKAIIGFWESLYVLQYCCSHPNLVALLSEILHTGDTLVKNILLDKHGPEMCSELKEIQKQHRAHLQQETQNLKENKPPHTTHGRKCFYISNRYVNLVTVSTHHFRQLSQDELTKAGEMFEVCSQRTRRGLQNMALNRLFHWCHRLKCVPRIVIASGVAGIGKSTLTQKFVYDWVNHKHYQRFSFVFFFKFRKLNRLRTDVSLEDMILDQYPYLRGHLDDILEDPNKLLFIFDGLDESTHHHVDFNSSRLCTDTKQMDCVGGIVVSLLKKTLLEGCSVLMTSRPTKLSSIATHVFERIVEIMGFSTKEKQMYFEYFFEDEELGQKAFQYVRENDSLYTFCYIPSYCWIICTVLSMCFKAQPTHNNQLLLLPKSLTQLFVIFVAHILSNHTQDKTQAPEILASIGQMADHGVKNRILIFDRRHLESFQVNTSSHLLSSFMVESDQTEHVTFTFIHLIFQEFFASLIHFLRFSRDNLSELLNEGRLCPKVHGEMVLRFVCGLSDNATRAVLRPYLKELSAEASRQVIEWLASVLKSEMLESYKNNRRLLNVFFYLFESRNKALVSETLKPFKCFEFFRVHHTPLNCAVLAFVLDCCEDIEKLYLNECNVRSEGLERLKPVLHKIKDISLYTNDLNDSAMESIRSALTHEQCKIQKLNLSDNALTSGSCSQLASAIRGNRTLRALHLSCNCLAGDNFQEVIASLAGPLCQIEEVSLRGTGLTNRSCPQLASVINNNPALLKFDLSYNNLEGPEFADVVAALSSSSCKLEELLLRYTRLSERSLTKLASGIRHNQSLRRLDLSENKLAGDHFRVLMDALSSPTCRIEELKLCGISLIDEQVPLLAQLSKNRNLRCLEFSSNDISDRSAAYITELIQNSSSLQEIRLENDNVSVESKENLRKLENSRPELKIIIW